MDSTIYTSLKKCFNITITGWKNKQDRINYQKKLLEEYPVIGGEAFCTFSQVMEMLTNPNEFLTEYFKFLKDIQACVDINGELNIDQFTDFFNKSVDLANQFCQKYHGQPYEQTVVVGIPVAILKLYRQMLVLQPEAKIG